MPDFQFLGNRLAVDFVNTQRVDAGRKVDAITSDADLVRWAREGGLNVSRACVRRSVGANDLLAVARRLRAAARRLIESRIDERPPAARDIGLLNRALLVPAAPARLEFVEGRYRLVPAPIDTPTGVLTAVAEDAAALLLGRDGGRLGRCSNDACVLMFVDRSRSRARRWCAMEVCGNRAKVAAHYRRSRTD